MIASLVEFDNTRTQVRDCQDERILCNYTLKFNSRSIRANRNQLYWFTREASFAGSPLTFITSVCRCNCLTVNTMRRLRVSMYGPKSLASLVPRRVNRCRPRLNVGSFNKLVKSEIIPLSNTWVFFEWFSGNLSRPFPLDQFQTEFANMIFIMIDFTKDYE